MAKRRHNRNIQVVRINVANGLMAQAIWAATIEDANRIAAHCMADGWAVALIRYA